MNLKHILIGNEQVQEERLKLAASEGFTVWQGAAIASVLGLIIVWILTSSIVPIFLSILVAYVIVRYNL